MSVDLNWSTLTSGPDGEALESSIRDFIHNKFQSVPLPRFIKSVTVHDFSFGTVPPELELKDITDPLPDFYEQGSDEEDSDEEEEQGQDDREDEREVPDGLRAAAERRKRAAAAAAGHAHAHHHHAHHPGHIHLPSNNNNNNNNNNTSSRSGGRTGGPPLPDLGSHFPPTAQSPMFFGATGALTPGIPGGTTNMHYFHSQFASGTQTPLLAAAAAGHTGLLGDMGSVHHSVSSPDLWSQGGLSARGGAGGREGGAGTRGKGYGHARQTSSGSILSIGDEVGSPPGQMLREKHSVSTLAPTSAGTSRPPTRDTAVTDQDDREMTPGVGGLEGQEGRDDDGEDRPRMREPRVEDMQAVFRIRYAGDVKLLLTVDILLDYPMPSFVGIPVRLSITGLTFDGVGVLAKIRKRAHFCFLSPEDAVAAVGGEENKEEVEGGERRLGGGGGAGGVGKGTKMGGLLQEIRVESEIGQREGGKQSLKNVGKVERFVLEQVRRIFEEEYVYPSFWTFLV